MTALYIGGYNDPMIALPGVLQMDFEELYKDLDSPVCLWRMDANENIDLVAGEANQLFPEVKGNLGAGLGSNLNQYVWRMESYNGKLYVGTFDIGSLAYPLMQVTNGDILKRSPEEWKTQFEYIIKLLELLKKQRFLGGPERNRHFLHVRHAHQYDKPAQSGRHRGSRIHRGVLFPAEKGRITL